MLITANMSMSVGISTCMSRIHVQSTQSNIYYIQSHEIQENIDEIKCIFYIFTSENIKLYIFTPFLDYL